MNDLTRQMELLKEGLQAFLPDRIVTRTLKPFDQRTHEDLQQGIFTLVSKREGDYTDLIGRVAQHGKRRLMLVGQFVTKEDAPGHEIEDLEGDMIDEVKSFLQRPPAGIQHLLLKSVYQSQQVDAPYGWISCELEMMAAS